MGWKPTGGEDEARTNPSPPRRRRRTPPSETPLVDKMMEASPRVHTGTRPPGGKQGSHESVERPQLKVKLGHRWSGIIRDVKEGAYTWADFCDGLDEEELARGQLRADNGKFVGRPPSFVPREFLLACQREQKRRFEELFGSEVLGLTKEYLKLCKDNSIPPKDRARLLQYAMERVFGGIPKDIRVSQEQPWEQMVVNVMRSGEEEMPSHLAQRYSLYDSRENGSPSEANDHA